MILSIVYGCPTITSDRDQTVDAINDFSKRIFRAAYPGAHLIEFFPWMRYIPSRLALLIHYNRRTGISCKIVWQGGSEILRLGTSKIR